MHANAGPVDRKTVLWILGFLTVCVGGRSEEELLNASSGEGFLVAACPSTLGTTPSGLTSLGELIHPPIRLVAKLTKAQTLARREEWHTSLAYQTIRNSTSRIMLGLGLLLSLRRLLYNHPRMKRAN